LHRGALALARTLQFRAPMSLAPSRLAFLLGLVTACGAVHADDPTEDGSASPDASLADAATRPTIVADELSEQTLWVQGQGEPFGSGAPHLVDAPEGDYKLTSYSTGNDIGQFHIDREGHFSYAPDDEGSVFTGTGTHTLTVHGQRVSFDTHELSPQRLWVHGDFIIAAGPNLAERSLVPGRYLLGLYDVDRDLSGFTVGVDGSVAVDDPTYLEVRNHNKIVVHGRSFEIDASGITPQRLWLHAGDLVFPSSSRKTFTLIPGAYTLSQYDVDHEIGTFRVDGQGQVDYDPALEGSYGGRGTGTLIVKGL
jgi:hypothetical protein